MLPLSSCDALNLAPEDSYSASNFWTNEAQVTGFMNGIHQNVRGNYERFFILGEARGGTMVSGNSLVNTSQDYSAPIKNNTLTKDQTGISNWYGIYGTLLQINLFIREVETGCTFLSQATRNKVLGQAYGMRALNYFLLYRTYGGVPIVNTVKVLDGKIVAEDLYTARSTPKETMTLIKDDIRKSEEHFGSDFAYETTHSLWSKYATLMLKAEVYLWSGKVTTGDQAPAATDIQTAKDALAPIVNGGQYSLMQNFANVSKLKNDKNSEVIFALRFLEKEATNNGSLFISADNIFINQVYMRDGKLIDAAIEAQYINGKSTGLLRHTYKYGLWASFSADDQRRDATFFDFYSKDKDGNINGGSVVLLKSLGEINSEGNRIYTTDKIIYRLADAYLMMAEIENKLGGDVALWMNKVRDRAYGEKAADNKFVAGSFADNELAILKERDKEFIWESKRWFDVVRMQGADGKAIAFQTAANYTDDYPAQVATAPIIAPGNDYLLLWPVNIGVMNDDPLVKQTPGY